MTLLTLEVGFFVEGFFAIELFATLLLADCLSTADFLLAGLPVVAELARADAARRATLATNLPVDAEPALPLSWGREAVFFVVTGFGLLLAFLVTDGFLVSLWDFVACDLAGALADVRDLTATAGLPLVVRLVAACCVAAAFFPVDLGPVDLVTTAFLPADVRARPTGALFWVGVFLGLKGCHPVN
ncbi:MAG: hypothetical protein ABI557_18715 [Aureliella sp.]